VGSAPYAVGVVTGARIRDDQWASSISDQRFSISN
jgi:hypothetical protein